MEKVKQKKLVLGVLTILTTWPSLAFAGDVPWWTFQDSRGGIWGIGEISDHLLIYLGHMHWATPIPTTKAGVLVCFTLFAATVFAVAVIYSRLKIRRTFKKADSQ